MFRIAFKNRLVLPRRARRDAAGGVQSRPVLASAHSFGLFRGYFHVWQHTRQTVLCHRVRRIARPRIGCVVDGCPPGMALAAADIQHDLDRRKPGTRATSPSAANPTPSRSCPACTMAGPPARRSRSMIRNEDQRSKDYGYIAETFRPGHADYTFTQKYGFRDPRGGGRSSARLTAPIVGAGA